MPAIPEIVIPDFSILDAGTQRYLTKLGGLVRPVNGIVVAQARCDGMTVVTRSGVNFENDGDGSGNYYDTSNGIQIDNDGDGTGLINGVDVEMDPLPRIPTIGTIPPIGQLAPLGTACGTLIRLEDRVLFDFDKATLRPQAGAVLDKVAEALRGVEATMQVNGHTDSMGSDAYNDDLSQRRAQAVADALDARGVGAGLDVSGFGEKQPIAKNSIKNTDNPAGRQLNRRVEIVIPN